jgi:hypothetical protein
VFRLGSSHIGFMESGVSIAVASRDTQNRPVLGRALACRVAGDGARVTILVSRVKYPLLLDALRRSGTIAVSFTEPSTDRSIQVKGAEVELQPAGEADSARIDTYFCLFTADLQRIAVKAELAHAALGCAIADLVTVAITPTVAFVQTPGAQAGSPIPA